MIWTI